MGKGQLEQIAEWIRSGSQYARLDGSGICKRIEKEYHMSSKEARKLYISVLIQITGWRKL